MFEDFGDFALRLATLVVVLIGLAIGVDLLLALWRLGLWIVSRGAS